MTTPLPRRHFRDDLRTVAQVAIAFAAVLFLFVGSHTIANHVGGWLIGR